MSTAIPVTTDTLPSNVPKLEIKGTNWAIFSLRLQTAVEAKELWKHFDGSTPRPVGASTVAAGGAVVVSPPDPDDLAKWLKNENLAKHLLFQRIPDSTALRVRNLTDVVAMWTEIVREYTEKGAYAQTDLRTKFLESKCPGDGDIRQFLDDLRAKRDELDAVGVQIEEKDYRSTIIQSLPSHLASFASGQLATARLYSPTQTIDPDILISLIIEESERRNRKDGRNTRAKTKSKDGDEALSVAPGGGQGGGRGGRRGGGSNGRGRQRPPCWNCGSREHFKADCKEPTKSADKDSTAVVVKGSAHAVADLDSEDDGVFAVDVLMEPDSDLPDLLSLSDSDSDAGERETFDVSDADWFSEVGDDDLPWGGDEIFELAAHVGNPQTLTPVVELYDSGSTRHISPYREQFETLTAIPPKSFAAANKQRFDATAIGDMIIEVPNGVEMSQLRLTEVLFSPEVGYTLVSIGRLDELGYSVNFADGVCTIHDPASELVGRIPKSARGLYRVVHGLPCDVSAAVETITVMELHRRMGHIAPSVARRLAENGLVSGVKVDLSSGESVYCESCVYAKATRKPIAKERQGERAKEFADEVHTDLWGPAPVETFGGRRYYVSFTDDKTRLTYLHLLRQKSEAFAAYKGFESWCQTQHGARVKVLHSDRGGEYLGKEFVMHLKAAGTAQKLTVHDTPQHNGVAERLNRTLLEKVRAMLHESGLPRALWGEAVRHAVWLKNRTPTKALDGGTPLEAATGMKPDLSRVRVWGSRVLVRIEGGSKLGGRVVEGRWMGIDEASTNGCRVYWPDRRTVTVERNVYWDDAELVAREGEQEHLPDAILTTPVQSPAQSTQPPAPVPVTPPPTPLVLPAAPTKRVRKPSQRVLDMLSSQAPIPLGIQLPTTATPEVGAELEGESVTNLLMAILEDADDDTAELSAALAEFTAEAEVLEPTSLAEARRRPDWAQWEAGIQEELATLKAAGTWELADLPAGANLVGSKWVFRAKKDAAGHVVRHKARLVAQGFSQVPGVDFFDTYAPVATLSSIRTVLALAARLDLELCQIDIKGAYLNGKLTDDEVIYMRQPPGFESQVHPSKVCRLRKTLYGLKQSGRRWYQRLVEILVDELGFTQCATDQAVFFRRRDPGEHTIVVVHVDDCTIAAKLMSQIDELKVMICKHVEITDLGALHWLLGIEVTRNRDAHTISLSQRSYVDSIIRRFNFEDLKPVSNPMEPSTRLHSGQSPSTGAEYAAMRHIPYREAVGSLMYASLGTRPDISYAVTTVSRFSSNPGPAHWDAVRRIYRYLLGTKDLKLTFGGVEKVLTGYADADGSMGEDRRAVSGYAFLIDGGAVSWSSKRQEIVSLSTTESEYVAATHAAKEALWLRSFIGQLFAPLPEPVTLFSDNQSAIALTKDHQYHARTKHIDIRFHFIRWVIEEGKLRLVYCPTADMVADTLTKALPSPKVKHFAVELRLRST
jgi:transposase InsO family protein